MFVPFFFIVGVAGEPIEISCEKDIFDIIGKEYVKPEGRNI